MSERSLHALALLAGLSLLKRRELGIPPGRCPTCAQRGNWVIVTGRRGAATRGPRLPAAVSRSREVIHIVHVDGAQWRPVYTRENDAELA